MDSTKIGLQGHSFGGYEVNYAITHAHVFAAAISSSGVTDFLTLLNDKIAAGMSSQWQTEVGQNRMNASMWVAPTKYIENSPLFNLRSITTPLLTVANEKDENIPYSQGLMLFLGMRRLGKPCLMLQYQDCTHGLWSSSQVDYVLRSTAFFDYYLKGGAEPAGIH